RSHVADGGTVCDTQAGRALAAELDELADHLLLAQQLGDAQHQVGRGDTFSQLALELDTHDIGSEQVNGLAKHAGFGFDAAHAPADHANAVDHGRVAVGAHERVGIIDIVGRAMHAARKIFQVYLVHDPEARRHDTEGVEGLHAPFHE